MIDNVSNGIIDHVSYDFSQFISRLMLVSEVLVQTQTQKYYGLNFKFSMEKLESAKRSFHIYGTMYVFPV